MATHAHPYSQVITYLRGMGTITIDGRAQPVGPGSVVFLPPRVPHGFDESGTRRALCLVLDLEWRGASRLGPQHIRLPASQMAALRAALSDILSLGEPDASTNRLVVGAAVLRILDILLRGLGALPAPERKKSAIVARVDRALRRSDPDVPIRQLCDDLGYQPDYLNRAFKRESGLSLREYRDSLRLESAKRALGDGARVQAAALAAGFVDVNYFARWFKKWTGSTPSAFARG